MFILCLNLGLVFEFYYFVLNKVRLEIDLVGMPDVKFSSFQS